MTSWERRDEPYDWNAFVRDNPEHFVERARFFGHYADDPARLSLLILADGFREAATIEDWQTVSQPYPTSPLEADELTRYENEDVPVRAHYLRKALTRLLKIVEAPEAMIADVDRFLGDIRPPTAEKYARAQDELLKDEAASITEISRRSGLNRSTIHELLSKGVLVRPKE